MILFMKFSNLYTATCTLEKYFYIASGLYFIESVFHRGLGINISAQLFTILHKR